jgi:hypothetical protein
MGNQKLEDQEKVIDKSKAKELNANFNWKLHVIHGVGHNQKKMAKAAAVYLYDN